MAGPTEEQKKNLDRKIERVEKHRRAVSGRKVAHKGLRRKEFHTILDKASQPIEKTESDSASSET